MKVSFMTRLCIIVAVTAAMGLATTTVLAHERKGVGNYGFVVGWIVEPAFEGIKNGLDLRVTNSGTQKPVEGLETTLEWELTQVSSGTTRILKLRRIFNDPGHYTADVIVTAPGVYRFRIFGSIEGNQVNETFFTRGGGGGFNDMESSADLQFPEKLPEIRELSGVTRTAQETAIEAKDAASANRSLAIVGVVLGAIAIASSAGAVAMARRKR